MRVQVKRTHRFSAQTDQLDRESDPPPLLIHQLVAAQAAAAPDALAIAMGTQAISYAELNRRANRLARHLHTLGAGPNILVGLCVDRSVDLVVGLLGILKAGAAYVPCDPSHPPDRLAFTLRDAAAPLLVTQRRWAAALASVAAQTVCLDTDAELLAAQEEHEPAATVAVEDLAYVIYTSGSTGQPKGVQITHGNLLNLIRWHQEAFQVTAADRATQVASPAFDAIGWELWPYLTLGASVHLPDDDDLRGHSEPLRDWLVAQHITISFLPTALAERMIMLDWPPETALRRLLTGADTLQRYPRAGLPFTLINNYGPTEVTVVCTSGIVRPDAQPRRLPTIGRPIANTRIYLLDEHLQPVPEGETGELCVGGAGVARGYLHRPELDAERFLPDPFSSEPGARFYRTGDLARTLPDGQLEFSGRRDDQLKIRGYRIEPGEIIAVLNQHPDVQTSFVMATEAISGEKRLVAYLVLAPGARISSHALQELLGTALPDYMIPAVFVALDTLPISPNGKVDRAALPPPTSENTLAQAAARPPMSPVEERVARMVATLLGLDAVDIDDNFFLLGGHSMLGAQLVVQLADVYGVQLPLRSLFEAPTVRRLSANIEELILAKVEAMSDDEAQQVID
jgi:amino acid adenylation domain-containing protein